MYHNSPSSPPAEKVSIKASPEVIEPEIPFNTISPIVPVVAFISPVKVAFDAVRSPFALTLKLEALIKNSLLVADPDI